jgi:multimeric flavodoxin WrbA
MQEIYPKLLAADALILASPVYFYNYSAQLKCCIDRWYGLWNNRRDFLRGKPVGVILTYEDTNLEISGGINAVHSLESTLNYIGAEYMGCVHGPMAAVGDAAKNPEIMENAAQLGQKLAEALLK